MLQKLELFLIFACIIEYELWILLLLFLLFIVSWRLKISLYKKKIKKCYKDFEVNFNNCVCFEAFKLFIFNWRNHINRKVLKEHFFNVKMTFSQRQKNTSQGVKLN